MLGGNPANAADPQPVTVLVADHSATGNTEKMAEGVAEGAWAVSGTRVHLKRVADVEAGDLSSSDAVIVGSPVYFANMSGEVETFLDNWALKFGLFQDRKMRNKVAPLLRPGPRPPLERSSRSWGSSRPCSQSDDRRERWRGIRCERHHWARLAGIDEKELAFARDLGRRVAEVAAVVRRGSSP